MTKEESRKDMAEREWVNRLSPRISKVMSNLFKERGMTKTSFARDCGYSQATVSNVFNPIIKDHRWSFPMLIAAADLLNTKVASIIEAAETGEEDVIQLEVCLGGTERASLARLDRIVKRAAPRNASSDLIEFYYSADMLQMCAPRYVEDYLSGKVSDGEAYAEIAEAVRECPPGKDLWVFVGEESWASAPQPTPQPTPQPPAALASPTNRSFTEGVKHMAYAVRGSAEWKSIQGNPSVCLCCREIQPWSISDMDFVAGVFSTTVASILEEGAKQIEGRRGVLEEERDDLETQLEEIQARLDVIENQLKGE